jgi:hypothetical protein
VTLNLTKDSDRFNFLIGEDGNVYEYLGFNLTTIRNSKFKDFFFFLFNKHIFFLSKEMKVHLLIGFMGQFKNLLPSNKMVNAYKKFYREGVVAGKICKKLQICTYEKTNCAHLKNTTYDKCNF